MSEQYEAYTNKNTRTTYLPAFGRVIVTVDIISKYGVTRNTKGIGRGNFGTKKERELAIESAKDDAIAKHIEKLYPDRDISKPTSETYGKELRYEKKLYGDRGGFLRKEMGIQSIIVKDIRLRYKTDKNTTIKRENIRGKYYTVIRTDGKVTAKRRFTNKNNVQNTDTYLSQYDYGLPRETDETTQ